MEVFDQRLLQELQVSSKKIEKSTQTNHTFTSISDDTLKSSSFKTTTLGIISSTSDFSTSPAENLSSISEDVFESDYKRLYSTKSLYCYPLYDLKLESDKPTFIKHATESGKSSAVVQKHHFSFYDKKKVFSQKNTVDEKPVLQKFEPSPVKIKNRSFVSRHRRHFSRGAFSLVSFSCTKL